VLSIPYDQNDSPTGPTVISPNSSLNATKSLQEYKKKSQQKGNKLHVPYKNKNKNKATRYKDEEKEHTSSSYPS
jgi:hypothetical protein